MAAQMEALGLKVELRYVITREAYDAFKQMFGGADATPPSQKRVRKHANPAFYRVRFPSDFAFKIDNELNAGCKAHRVAKVLASRPNPHMTEDRKEMEQLVISTLSTPEVPFTEQEARCQMHYLAVVKSLVEPITERLSVA